MRLHHAQDLFSARCNSTGESGREGCPGLPSTVGKTELHPWCEVFALLDARWQNTHLRATDPFLSANCPFSTVLVPCLEPALGECMVQTVQKEGMCCQSNKQVRDRRQAHLYRDKADSSLATVSLPKRRRNNPRSCTRQQKNLALQEKAGGEKSE